MAEARAQEFRLARIGGLEVIVTPLGAVGTLLLGAIFFLVGRFVFNHGLANAIVGGVLLAYLHWVSEIVHQLGHNAGARRVGHPMTGVRLGFLLVLGTSIYPADEAELPARAHIQRAVGGPLASAALSVGIGVLALLFAGTSIGWVLLVWFINNLLVFTLGSLLPLGFTDGSTLLHYLGRRNAGAA
jgi:hypothetical protein